MKVESPITATIFLSFSDSLRPLVEAVRHAHRRAHRDARVERVPRLAETERIAADVAGNGDVAQLRQRVIDAQVRAGDAHRRRPRKDLHRRGRCDFRQRLAEQARDRRLEHGRRQFADARQDVLADRRDALRLDFGFDQRLDFLDDDQSIALLRETAHQRERHRVGKAELQNRRVGEGFAHVHVRRSRSDETDAAIGAGLDHVERRNFSRLAQLRLALEHQRQPLARCTGNHHPAADVLGKSGGLMRATFADRDQRLDVADARRQAQDHRALEAFGKRKGGESEVVRFLRIGGFEHRQMRETAPVARVLFVLRRRQADVVGHCDHQTASDAGQRHGHQRVRGDVQTDVLHRAEGARTGHRGTESDFQRDLFVDRPFGIDVLDRSQSLRASRSPASPDRPRRRARQTPRRHAQRPRYRTLKAGLAPARA